MKAAILSGRSQGRPIVMSRYKLRAECRLDVEELRHVLRAGAVRELAGWEIVSLTVEDGALVPDVEVTFASALSLEALRRACENVPDGHVMAETIARADEYTGERKEKL
jgi:hypothetical protein